MVEEDFKVDLHVHTVYSRDAFTEPKIAVKCALKRGLRGIAVTDHHSVRGAILARKYASGKMMVIPGVEVKCVYGHFLLLNIDKLPAKSASMFHVFDWCRLQGGIVILAHPYGTVIPPRNLGKIIRHVDAVEVINSNSFFFRGSIAKALNIALKNNLGKTAGSDSHVPQTIGLAYSIFNDNPENVDDLLASIKAGNCEIYGKKSNLYTRVLKWTKTVKRYF